MRRVVRWAVHGAAAVSTLLFVAACVLWVRSRSNADYLYYTATKGTHFETFGVLTRRGILQIDDFRDGGPHQWVVDELEFWKSGVWGPWDWGSIYIANRDVAILVELQDEDLSRGGVGFHEPESAWAGFGSGSRKYPWMGLRGRGPRPPDGSCRFVTVPFWSVVTLASLLPITAVTPLLRRQLRGLRGTCRSCGYDLRATPDRCPECGAAPAATRPTARAVPVWVAKHILRR